MREGHVPEDRWQLIQSSVPIACVDVLVWRPSASGGVREVGLILRDTPHEGQRWCLLGGRLLLDERLVDAVRRQVRETLGTDPLAVADQPLHVAEYDRTATDRPHDPRKHAIGMTWAVQLAGPPSPRGEGLDFRWFPEDDVPELGFGQQAVLRAVLAALEELEHDRAR